MVGTILVMYGPGMKNVLVIDDDDAVRTVVVATLLDAGFVVREAKDGRVGIQMILAERPDLILCDVKMPSMDGYRTLSAIRKYPGTAAIPLILMTGSDTLGRDGFRRGMAEGADDFLLKPFTADELLAAIESRRARQRNVREEAWKIREQDTAQQFAQGLPARVNGAWEAIPYIRKRVRA
jgi:CheY-like chemotaxis protein